MQHVLETGKRALSVAVAAATIAFSIGAGVLMNPGTTQAASAGDLIRSQSLSTVYYYGYDGMRYTFPNPKTYQSWYMGAAGQPDFSGVQFVSDSTISNITLGGNIVVRPGTYWIKINTDPKVYAVARDGSIHWIESEAVAVDYAGSDWNQRIIDVPDVFFADYSVGTSLMSATPYDGMLYMDGGTTFLAWEGEKREVTSAGMSANGLETYFVLDGAGINDSSLSGGAALTSEELVLVDAAQTEEGTAVPSGSIMVSAASSMPAGASIPGGANAVEVFSFTVKAGSQAAEFDGVTLTMIGAGSASNISNVYLYEGSTRLTESRTVNSSTRQVSFSNLNQSIAANASHTYTARVTISTSQTPADTFGFKIDNSADVVSGGSVTGSFPIMGNIFTLTGSDAGTLTITKTGTIADPTLGEQDAEIGQFKATASGSEAASIEEITVKVDNASDHSDFRLWDGNVLLDQGVNASGDWVTFDLSADPFAIEEGGNNIFSVSADIGGQAADTIKVFIDNPVDVVAIGSDFGFGLTVDTDDSNGYDGTSCTSASGKCSFSTIQGGKVTIAFNGPAAGDVQVDAQDQVLLEFSITASQFVTIKDLDIQVAADDDADGDPTDGVEAGAGVADDDGLINTGAEANLKDIKIVNMDSGSVVMGPLELDTTTDDASNETSLTGAAEDALQIIDFTDDWSLEAGETVDLAVSVDIDNGLTSGTALAAILDISGLSVEDQNGDALASSEIVPGSDITGYNQTARSASLTFALASTPSSTTTVDGTDNVSVVGFSVTAGEASNVTITDFTLTAYGDDDGTPAYTIGGGTNSDINDYVESCSLYNGDDATVLLAGPEAPASNGQTIRFDTITWTIDAGAVELLTAKCSFANTSTSGNAYFGFDINDVTTDVTAEDEDGDSLAASALSGSDVNGGTTPTRVVTLADAGSLAISVSASTPSADIILSNSNNNHVATYRFAATNEAFTVQTLTFTEEQAEDDSGTADSSLYANNIALATISYPKADGTTGTASAAMSGNEAKFSGLDMHVPVDAAQDVKVYVNVPLTDRDSGGSSTSNERVRMGFSDGDNSGSESFKAVGVGSGSTLDEASSGVVDIGDDAFATDGVATFVVRETKPTITLSSSSPSGSAVVGRSEVLRFNVAASSNEDVVLNRLMFKFNATDNAGDGTPDWNECDTDAAASAAILASEFDIYNLTVDGTTQTLDTADSDWTLYRTTGVTCTTTAADLGFALVAFPTAEIVPKGQSYAFALYFDSTGASASQDDSIRFDLPTDPILASASFLAASDLTESNVTATDSTLSVTDGTAYAVGDVICMDTADDACGTTDEKMIVTAISTNDLTVVRGYLGTAPDATLANDAADDVDRVPGTLLWQDDGVDSANAVGNFWGSYLVDNLTVNGGTLVF